MSDKETADYLREWAKAPAHGLYAWPTDACGYDQHMRFVTHRNQHWEGYSNGTFNQFVLDYADLLDPPVHFEPIVPRLLALQMEKNAIDSQLLATTEVALTPPPVLECDALRHEYHVKGGCCASCHARAEGRFDPDCWYHIQGRMRYVCCTVASSVGERRLPDKVEDGRHLLLN